MILLLLLVKGWFRRPDNEPDYKSEQPKEQPYKKPDNTAFSPLLCVFVHENGYQYLYYEADMKPIPAQSRYIPANIAYGSMSIRRISD